MKIVFMGTPVFATNILQSLIDNYEVVGVVSQPDKEVGNHGIVSLLMLLGVILLTVGLLLVIINII